MRTRVLMVLTGAALLGYGVVGLLGHAVATRPPRWAADLLAVSLVHDLVLAPLVLALVVVGRRLLPASWEPAAAAFLLVGGCLVLVAVPVLVKAPMPGGNSSLLPRNYVGGLATALVAAAVAVAAAFLAARLAHRRTRR